MIMFRTILAAAASLVLAAGARAQSTAFTYQGQLKNGGALAEGLHDFRFNLFDAASGGTQVGSTQCADNIQVKDGVFTATIDFGNQFATPNQRFIEILVRQDTGLDCSNSSGYDTLSPRQVISAAPMATHAKSAFSLDAADGSPANVVFVDNNGNVGIGTTSPTHSVHIANPAPTLALQDTDSTGTGGGQQVGYVSYRDSGNVERAWVGYGSVGDPDFSIVNARTGGDILLNPFNGNVGIGTSVPAAKLEVRGDIRLGTAGQYFANSGEENLRTIRGTANGNGTVAFGTGWTVARTAAGSYTVFFNTSFSDRPTVVASSGNTARIAVVATPVQGNVAIRLYNTTGTLTDDTFYFIATGPR